MTIHDTDRFLRAYFHTFEPTGADAVDGILEAIALAGKAYHNTIDWSDAEEYGDSGYWSLIQTRANDAARVTEATTQLLDALEDVFGMLDDTLLGDTFGFDWVRKAKAAIALAKGEQA